MMAALPSGQSWPPKAYMQKRTLQATGACNLLTTISSGWVDGPAAGRVQDDFLVMMGQLPSIVIPVQMISKSCRAAPPMLMAGWS